MSRRARRTAATLWIATVSGVSLARSGVLAGWNEARSGTAFSLVTVTMAALALDPEGWTSRERDGA
jgi:hypothetical protein